MTIVEPVDERTIVYGVADKSVRYDADPNLVAARDFYLARVLELEAQVAALKSENATLRASIA